MPCRARSLRILESRNPEVSQRWIASRCSWQRVQPSPRGRLQYQQHVAELFVAYGARLSRQPGRFRCPQIAAHRFRIEAEPRRDPFLRQMLLPESQDFPQFDHGDLAIYPRLLLGTGPRTADDYRVAR